MKDFMPPKMSIKIIGENGFVEEQELTAIEVKNSGLLNISVSSRSEQETIDTMRRDSRIKAIQMVAQNPER